MFGNTNDIRNQTENNNTNEACYGGFGGRFSYEECQKSGVSGKILRSIPKIAIGTAAFALLGMLGVFCAAMMYSIVSDNHSVYPKDASAATMGGTQAPQQTHVVADNAEADAQILSDIVPAENITVEQALLYRVPTGVLISELDEGDAAYSVGLRGGDIVVAIEGRALSSVEELSQVISERHGDTVELTLFRDDTYMKIYVSLE